jgi:hypothetical protein
MPACPTRVPGFLFVLLAASLTATAASAERTGALVGSVTDEITHRPIVAATVRVETADLKATSDASGRFTLAGVPVGTQRLLVEAAGYVPRRLMDVVVTQDRETTLAVDLTTAPTLRESVDVEASSFARPTDVAASVVGMSYEEIRRAPGAFGGDVGRLVQSLPGLAGRDDLRNDIVARGGSPSENLILVDGVEVPSISHFGAQGASGGPITMLSAEVVGDARFTAGGFPARFGERLSSVLEVFLREGDRRRRQAEIDVGTSGAGLVAEGPLGRRGSWLLSGRRSYVDLIAGSVEASAIPIYSNYQAKLVYDLGQADRLSLVSLGGRETLAVDVAQQEADDPNTLNTDQLGWRTTTGLAWQRLFGARGVGTLTVSDSRLANRTDAWDTAVGGQLVLHNDSQESETGARYEAAVQSRRLGTLAAGASIKRLSAGLARQQPLGQEDPFSTDPQRVNAYDLRDDYSTWQAGGFAQLTRSLGSRLSLTVGGRVDHFAASDATRVAPRASLVLRPHVRLELSLAAGRYFQMPGLVFLRAAPENARLEPMRADHLVAGLALTPRPDLRITVEAYAKRYDRYPVARDYTSVSLANLGDAFDTNLFLVPLLSRGTGRARGIEVYVQKKLGRRFYGQASYAYSRVEHRAQDGVLRPGRFDLPHVATAVGGVKLSRALEVSSRLSVTSGRPITPFDQALSRQQNREVYDVSRINGQRAPEYFRLDLRADRRFALGFGNLVLYLEVDNVTDRDNVREYIWNKRENRLDTAPQAGRMIIGGLNLEL